MHSLAVIENKNITPMSQKDIASVYSLEGFILSAPQEVIPTHHTLHAGVYSRTIRVPKGVVLTGAIMIIPTLLIIQGDFILFVGDKAKELHGYNVFTCEANRKQAGIAISDTYVTMIFPTDVKTTEEAEDKFTSEADHLWSRSNTAINIVNYGEQ